MPPRSQSNKRAGNSAKNRKVREQLTGKSIVLIGLMGAGKTAIGRRLATRLGLEFVDADSEIERAAGKSISDIFSDHGEEHFRDGERKVIARLLGEGSQILATGGGAYMNDETRDTIAQFSISVWLKGDLEVLMERVVRRDHRPLLKTGDPKAVMKRLMDERYPVYASADITIQSRDVPHEVIVTEIMTALTNQLESGNGDKVTK